MTVSAPATYPETFECNSFLTKFDFSFGVRATSEVEVIHKSAAGVETILTENDDYIISATNDDYSNGGRITTTETYISGVTLTARMVITLTQGTNFTEGMATLYESFEMGLDKLTRITQQLDERINRSLSFTATSEKVGDGIVPNPSALKFLRWNTGGLAIENADLTTNLADLSAHALDGQAHKETVQAVTIGASGILDLASYTAYNFFSVSAETGVADTLVQITGLDARNVVVLSAAVGHTIVVEEGTNIRMQADFTLASIYDKLTLEAIDAAVVTALSRAQNE